MILILAFPAIGAADDPFRTPLVERAEVRFITFDLAVEEHDPGGWRPARDLRKEQITLLVGGTRTPLDLFESACGEAPASAPEVARGPAGKGAGAAKPGPPAASADGAPAGAEVARYILYFEETHLTFANRRRSYRAALDWAATAPPLAEAMIVVGGYGLRIARPMLPVSQRLEEDIREAMDDLGSTDLWGNQEDDRIEDVIDLMRRSLTQDPPQALANAYGEEAFQRGRRALENMTALMVLFGKVEGTKNLILFSDKLRKVPGEVYPLASDLQSTIPYLMEVAMAANERDVRIYPVQATGLDGDHKDSADDALTMLASETGGRVVQRTNRLGLVFDRVKEDIACSYRVGFHLRARYSGTAQRIEVRVSGPARGYRARHRRSVDDPTRETIDADVQRAAMIDPASARDLPVKVRAAPLDSGAAGSRIRIEVSVAVADLLGLPKAGSAPGTRRLLVQVGGRIVPLRARAEGAAPSPNRGTWADVDTAREALPFSGQAEITIPPGSPGAGAGITTLVRIAEARVPSGAYRVVAVVEDRQTQTVGAGLADFRAAGESSALGPVGLLVEDPGSVLIRGAPEEIEKAGRPASGRRAMFVEPELPAKAVLAADGVIEKGRDAEVYYSVCGIPAGEGKVERLVRCGGGGDPLRLPPLLPPAPRSGETCALIVERIPAALLSGPECEIAVVLVSPGRLNESRTLALHLRASAGGDASGPPSTRP